MSDSRRIKLVVSYDGTDFNGWANQSGRRTVQTTLTEAIHQVSAEEVEIIGASRTDSGAHAKAQVCHFDSTVDIEPAKWTRILNNVLPDDLAVVSSRAVSPKFHSRFGALDRFYRYRIMTGPRDALRSRYTHQYGRPLNLPAMQEAAKLIVGEHDFLAFTEELDPSVGNTRRLLYSVNVRQMRDELWVDIVGTAFLRGMMRRISGALLEVGRGKRTIDEVGRLLTTDRDNLQWPVVLPARGLCLMRVRYGRKLRDNRNTVL
jgi:tRNA pseudouridine38-40 synthase